MPPGEGHVRVLLVDDDPAFAEMAGTFLERADGDFVVSVETDPTNVLGRLEAGDFHCVVSDYAMPGVDGLDLLTAVRDNHADIPFVLFTAHGSEEVASEAISAGVTDYVRKDPGSDQYETLAIDIRSYVEETTAPGDADRRRAPTH